MSQPGHSHLTKVCPRCGKRKTLSKRNFVYSTRKGKRHWHHCRVCNRAYRKAERARIAADPVRAAKRRAYKREWQRRKYAENPEAMRAKSREYKARLKAEDPDRAFELLVLPKRFKREGRDYSHNHTPTREPYVAAGRWTDSSVPAGPLVDYLRATFPGWRPGEIGSYIGVNPRLIFAAMNGESDRLLLDSADRIVTKGLGRPDLLNSLYPMELQ